jgi:moderate conductance mechanosensitive channel
VSQKLISAILLAFGLLATPAFTQRGAALANDALPAAANKPDALTPDQARQALDTLQDDQKRAQMIETLRTIAKSRSASLT